MCKWGTEKKLKVKTLPSGKYKKKGIDACVFDIVRSLNAGGVITTGSCCGHGKNMGEILLEDGRKLYIGGKSKTKKDEERERRFMACKNKHYKSSWHCFNFMGGCLKCDRWKNDR